jgi:hypothetical protein
MILKRVDLSEVEHKRAPLAHHKQGLQYTATGYGSKIPTEIMIKQGQRWRRVYVCCFSNAGTAYILQGKDWIVVTGEPTC